jgi:hypothetical protein
MAVAKVMKKDTEKNMSLRKLWKWSSHVIIPSCSIMYRFKLIAARCQMICRILNYFKNCNLQSPAAASRLNFFTEYGNCSLAVMYGTLSTRLVALFSEWEPQFCVVLYWSWMQAFFTSRETRAEQRTCNQRMKMG